MLLLFHYYVRPSKYRGLVFREAVDKSIKCVFLEISKDMRLSLSK